MPQIVRFRGKDGGEVLVETNEADAGRMVGRRDETIEAPRTFDDALSGIRPVAEAVLAQVNGFEIRPAEVTVELGISLKAEAGVIIAKTAVEGNLKLTIKWHPSS